MWLNRIRLRAEQQSTINKREQPQFPRVISKINLEFITQQNFTIYPYIYGKEVENHKYVMIPARTQWFNLNNVHDIERKALP
jgi:hypothetical protein